MHTLICRHCGKTFESASSDSKYCSRDCYRSQVLAESNEREARLASIQAKQHEKAEKANPDVENEKKTSVDDATKRRNALRLRDAEYARWERENGITARVIETDTKVIEVRGQLCGGARTSSYIHGN